MRESLPSNGTTTITKSEFSDDNFDEEEVQDEESAPDDGRKTDLDFISVPHLLINSYSMVFLQSSSIDVMRGTAEVVEVLVKLLPRTSRIPPPKRKSLVISQSPLHET